jgi:ribonuclease HII
MICGVDEAGRGPVIGPLVVAGVLTDSEGIKRLSNLGVRDSKKHTPSQRKALYDEIRSFAAYHSVKIEAKDLDELMAKKSLNQIEARIFALVIEKLAPEIAYIDSGDVSCRNFKLNILKHLKTRPELVVEHKADERYPVVSAASILAKVERDREIERLHKIYGDFGSGYASDEKTKEFLQSYFEKTRSFPDCVRRKWKTTSRLSNLKLNNFY